MSTLGVAGEPKPCDCGMMHRGANLAPRICPVLATGLPGQS